MTMGAPHRASSVETVPLQAKATVAAFMASVLGVFVFDDLHRAAGHQSDRLSNLRGHGSRMLAARATIRLGWLAFRGLDGFLRMAPSAV